jgi:uncharacterized protein YhaN
VRIRRVRLVNFRRFRDREVSFGPGLNLIVGPNEAGKSTILDGIATALFCDVASTAKAVKDLERWGSKGAMRLELDFEHDGEIYRLRKDFGARRAVLEKGDGSETLGDRGEVEARLREMVGFREQQAFESVAAVRQGELAALEGKGGKSRRSDLLPMIEKKMTSSSGATDAAGVIGRLEKSIAAMGVGVKRLADRPGPIRSLMDQEEELAERISRSGKAWADAVRTRKELTSERADLAKAEQRLESIEGMLESEGARSRYVAELEDVRQKLSRNASEVGKLRKLKTDIAEAYEGIDGTLPELGKTVEEAKRDFDAAGERIAKLEERSPAGDWRTASKRPGAAAIVLGAAALALFFAPVYAPIPPGVRLWLILGGAALGALTVYFFRRGARLWGFAHDMQRELGEKERAERSYREALGAAGVSTYEEYGRLAARQQELHASIQKWNALLQEQTGEGDADKFEESLLTDGAALERRAGELEEKLEESGGAENVLSPVEAARLRNERNGLLETIDRLRKSTIAKEVRLEEAAVDTALPDLEARRENVARELALVLRRERVLRLAHEGLLTALDRTKREASTALAPVVSRVLGGVTLGRYSDVSVATDLEFSVKNPDPVEGAPPTLGGDELSAGTIDQFYLAVRYALLEFLSGPCGAPFLLDDVLVHFDPERRDAAIGVLREIARQRQVIMLSCENHAAESADEVVRLDGVNAGSASPGGEAPQEVPRER